MNKRMYSDMMRSASVSSAPARPRLRPLRVCLALSAALLISACATPLKPGAVDAPALPGSWSEAVATPSTTQHLEADWWRSFESAELAALIDQALAGSPDLRIATERVVQAEIAVRTAGASLFPALNLSASTQARETGGSGTADASDQSNLGLALSYEIDIWGSNMLALEGSRAQLAATRFDYEGTRLSLVAGVANAYAQILAQRARIEIARNNLEIAERLFRIVEARYQNGAASALDVSRQRATVMSARDSLLPMETQERQLLRALALLTGNVPQGFDVQGGSLYALTLPPVDAGLPAELLARRPDIAAVEARLLGADANIAVARAALFPLKLSLGLTTNLSSGEFGFVDLANPAHAATLTLSLVQAIFDGGRLRGQVESAESSRRQLVEQYRSTVLTALKEVDDVLGELERSRRQEESQRAIRDEYSRALQLSELRYREGSDSLTTLLDAQRSLFSAEDTLLQQRLTRLTATINLYKALGGGWLNPELGVQPDAPAGE